MAEAVQQKARFVVNRMESSFMDEIGRESVRANLERWDRALLVDGSPAPVLKLRIRKKSSYSPYARRKQRKGLRPVRDLLYTGKLRESIRVLQSSENTVAVGPSDSIQETKLYINQAKARMWGVSEEDRAEIGRKVLQSRPVSAEQVP